MLDRSMEGVVETKAFLGNTKITKTAVCNLCNEVIYNLPDNPTKAEVSRELDGAILHLELRHGFRVDKVHCTDPRCVGGH